MFFTDHLFIFYFFPIFFAFYMLVHRNLTLANIIIIIFSLIFYASFGFTNVLIFTIPLLLDFYLGTVLYKTTQKKIKKIYLWSGIIVNIGMLAYFKYSLFAIYNLGFFLTPHLQQQLIQFQKQVIIPVGISFITFQRISYIVDIYRKKTKPEKNFLNYVTYASLFPHLIAGPIVRYSQIKDSLSKRSISSEQIYTGFKYFVIGMFLKVLIADKLFPLEQILKSNINSLTTFDSSILMLYFSLRIYFDFSGYSLIAIGLAKFMGFNFPSNFNAPYRSTSIREFWRRWNITLSLWLRDYIYIPLGGNRNGKINQYKNILITMLIGGLWHGANWNFILWGFLHGSYQIVEHLFSHLEIKLTLPVRLKQFLIFSLVTVTWTTFMFASPTDIVKVLSGLLHLTTPFAWLHIKKELVYSLPSFIGAILLVIFFTEEQVDRIPYSLKASLLLSVLFIFIVATKLLENRVPFFYFQF